MGYNEQENALYVAVEVRDADEPEPEDGSGVFYTNDLVVVVALPGAGVDPLILGFLRDKEPAPGGLAQTVTEHGTAGSELARCFEVEARSGADWRSYESRIDLTQLTATRQRPFQLRPMQKLELGLRVHDLDDVAGTPTRHQSTLMSWVHGVIYARHSGRGEILPVRSGVGTGRLHGRVKPLQGPVEHLRKRVRIEALDVPGLVVHVLTDGTGHFAVDLPVGRYKVGLEERGRETRPDFYVELAAGGEQRVGLLTRPVTGRDFPVEPSQVQKAGRGMRQGPWRTYGVGDGLPSATVLAMVQDWRGELWLVMEGAGLVRFDGARFTSFDIQGVSVSPAVPRIVEDRGGNLWFVAGSDVDGMGLVCLDRERRRLRRYDRDDGFNEEFPHDLAVDNLGRVCVASAGGVSRFDPDQGQFNRFTVEDGLPSWNVTGLSRSAAGGLWIGSYFSHKIAAWEDHTFRLPHLCPKAIQAVECLFEDRAGRLWVAALGTEDEPSGMRYLWCYDGQRWAGFLEEQGYYRHNPVQTIYEDHAGHIWLGTSGGLFRFGEGKFEDFGTLTGLGKGRVHAIFEDREGRLWVGVEGVGLKVLDPAWVTYTQADGLPHNQVNAVAEWEGRVIVGTFSGLCRESGAGFEPIPALTNQWIHWLFQGSQGQLYVHHETNVSLLRQDGRLAGANAMEQKIIAEGGLRTPPLESAGKLWLLPLWDGGVCRHDEEGKRTRFTTRDGLASDSTSCLGLDNQNGIWIGTAGGGLAVYDAELNLIQASSWFDGLGRDTVDALTQAADGSLWIGTRDGLTHYRMHTNAPGIRITGAPTGRWT